jgi:signal transduction histidine kinase
MLGFMASDTATTVRFGGWRLRLGARRSVVLLDTARAVVLAVVLVAASVDEAYPKRPEDRPRGVVFPHPPHWAYGLVALATVALAVRRLYPLMALSVATAAVLAYTCLGYVDGAALLAPALAVYGVAVATTTRRAVAAASISLVALMAANAAFDPLGTFGGGFTLLPGLFAAPLFLGFAVKNRRAYLAAVEDRAAAAERSRDEEARRQVDAERLRIARELHDVVAHTMALINVQAGVAEHIAVDRPDKALAALTGIKLASKDGMRELRAILGVLRQADEGEPTTPAPRLSQIDDLLQAATAAGLPVTVHTTGTPCGLPATLDLTAYRIVQESLTNAVRHSPGATTVVALHYQPELLRIDIVNAAGAATAPDLAGGSGHGILGMRERASVVGGTLDAGPCPDGGFAVRARLPIGTSE